MPGTSLGTILGHVRRLALPSGAPGRTDAQLLRDFAQRRDEAAFVALMQRHGGLVWGVCRRVLTQEQDAEDAFQATFLALARQAATIRATAALASWLHGTAQRIALNARRAAVRRRNHELQARPAAAPSTESAWRELQAVLDDEVQRLPERERAVFVLRVLEGKGLAEAAEVLSWKPGTVSGTLARARQRLRTRLNRRGLALSALLTALAVAPAARASAPLTHAALRLVLRDGAGVVPFRIAALAQEAVKPTGRTIAIRLTVLVLTVAFAAASGTLVLSAGRDSEPAGRAGEQRPAAQPADDLPGEPVPPGAVGRLGTARFRHGDEVRAFALSRDGKQLAIGGGNTVVVWDAATGRELCRCEGHKGTVNSVAFAPDGTTLASSADDNVVRLWDAATGKELRRLRGHAARVEVTGKSRLEYNGVWGLTFTPDGKTLVSRGVDQTIRLWDVATGQEARRIDDVPGYVESLALSPDGTTLAAAVFVSGPGPSEVRLWDVATGKELRRLARGALTCVAFSPDGRLLAAGTGADGDGGAGGIISLWEVATGKQAGVLQGHTRMILSLAFAPDGKTLVSGSLDYTTRRWDVASCKELGRVGEGEAAVGGAAFSPDGRLLVLGAGYVGDHTVRFWDVAAAKELGLSGAHRGTVTALSFSADGRLLATGSADRTLGLWDVATRRELRHLPANEAPVRAAVLAPDGRLLRYGGGWGGIHTRDTATGNEAGGFDTKDGLFPCVAFSPDGKLAASWPHEGGAGTLWDAVAGKELRKIASSQMAVHALAFSPNGLSLAVGGASRQGLISLYEVGSGRLVREFTDRSMVWSLAFSPDGRTLASGHHDEAVRLWETATGGKRLAFVHGGKPTALAFSLDGLLLASASDDGPGTRDRDRVRIWDALTGTRLATLAGHEGAVASLAFSPDGRLLASGGEDTTVLLWDATRLPRGARRPDTAGDTKELRARWSELTGEDAAAAYRAMQALVANPKPAVVLLREHLRPVVGADVERVRRLLAELDSDEFAKRERAARELEKLGAAADEALRKALADHPSAEVCRRIEALLSARESRQDLGQLRGLEVLERIGTGEAREWIDTLARGTPGAWLTREAAAAAERLARRPGS